MPKFFSYDPDGDGFDFWETEDEARAACQKAWQECDDLARDDEEYPERAGEICWGEIRQINQNTSPGKKTAYYELREPT